jgi:hypothetical protein
MHPEESKEEKEK